jgi:hypothetical protein
MSVYLRNVALGIILGLLGGLLLGSMISPAHSRDNGQWENSDSTVQRVVSVTDAAGQPDRAMLWHSRRLLVRRHKRQGWTRHIAVSPMIGLMARSASA